MVDEARARRQQPRRLGVEEGGGDVAGPEPREQCPGKPGVGEQEFAPLVDQLATDREGGLVRGMFRKRVDEDLRSREPLQVGTTHGVEVPRPSDQVGIVGFMSSGEPLGVHALGCEQGVQLGGGPSRHPGTVADRRVSEKRQPALEALPPRPVWRPIRDYQMPARVPAIGCPRAIDPSGSLLEATLGAGGEGISRCAARPGWPAATPV